MEILPLSVFAQRFGLDLSSPFDPDSKRLESTVFTIHVRTSLLNVNPTSDTFVRPVPDEPGFDKVGTLLAAECWLLLDAPECRGKLRSSEAVIVASYSCWKLMFLVGRLIG